MAERFEPNTVLCAFHTIQPSIFLVPASDFIKISGKYRPWTKTTQLHFVVISVSECGSRNLTAPDSAIAGFY